MFQPLYNFEIGSIVQFENESESYKIVRWEYHKDIFNEKDVRDVTVVLEKVGSIDDPHYAHPLYRVREVKESK